MLIAGEPSGDLLASELVLALRERWPDAKFFGAGGARMAAAGVELAFDMRDHAIVGIPTPGKRLALRYVLNELRFLAAERKPDAVIGVDYGAFNLRFGHAIKQYVRSYSGATWNPKLVQFVSPQVWASRPGRAKLLEADYDLLLSIFPFEKDWYAERAPKLRVEFVGHPMVERYAKAEGGRQKAEGSAAAPTLLLLPGSRTSELKRHLPVMLDALEMIQRKLPESRAKMILPSPALKELADKMSALPPNIETQVGDLPQMLAQADVAIAST